MKNQKDKQLRELRNDFNNLLIFCIVCILIFSGYGIYKGIKVEVLEQELQSCQDKVPVWTLKVECNFFGDIDGSFKGNFFGEYYNYEDYLEHKMLFEEDKNCEVIE